ncbi:MAG: hypothetical protein K2Y35_12870 [Burkholderiales bacterium]|nr:hypothetical protein [Burkholderiales bacterium]
MRIAMSQRDDVMYDEALRRYAESATAVAALFENLPAPYDEGMLLLIEEDIDLLSAAVMELNVLQKHVGRVPSSVTLLIAGVRNRLAHAIRAKVALQVALSVSTVD